MNFKLDENLGRRAQSILQEAGHDAETVRDEGFGGISDDDLFQRCRAEFRCLVTLDLDFADVLRYPPHESPGVVVLRNPDRDSWSAIAILISISSGISQATLPQTLCGS